MKAFVLSLFLVSGSLYAQGQGLAIGPVAALDQLSATVKPYTRLWPNDPTAAITYKTGLAYGLGATYLRNRWLLGARLFTTQRVYNSTGHIPLAPGPNAPFSLDRVQVDARYYFLPVTVSYL